MTSRSRNLLIGCGALVLIAACVGTILVVGGFGALGAIFGPDPEGLTVGIAVEPAVVAQGDTFNIVVTAGNTGSRSLEISSVNLPGDVLNGALLTGVSPADQGRDRFTDYTSVAFARTLAAGEQTQFVFTFQAVAAGNFEGDLDVVVGVRQKITPVRLVIKPAEQATIPQQATPLPTGGAIPFRSVVQIIALYEEDGELYEGWTGSGSIITPDGLILTNAHVVLPDKYFAVDGLVVALTEQEDQPPVAAYFAEVLQADEALDIAVIKVTTDLDGVPVTAGNLNLPTVPMGKSNDLTLGDAMYIIGYPGIGGETITLTSGEVSGFTAEAGRGERAFIKTSATIAGGNSGGLASNAQGELIGVPTQLGYGGDDQYVDCRVLADTNRDGYVDDSDNCIPTGGFINALRPLELALPLIEAAQRGEVAIESGVEPEQPMTAEGSVLYSEDFSDTSSGWDIADEGDYAVGYQNGRYEMELRLDNYFVWSIAGENFQDAYITVEAEPMVLTGEGDYGVVCRYQDADNYYALEVSEDGFFTIWKRVAGEFIPLVDWEESDILPLDGSMVTIQAACVGNSLGLAADGVLLAEVQDNTFSEGDVGLIAGTWDTVGLVIAYDNFVVHGP